MLRYIFLAGLVLLSADSVFSQVFYFPLYQPIDVHAYRQIDYRLSKWAKGFADSAIKKVLVEPRAPLTEYGSSAVHSDLPPGMRPVDYIGRDGLPGDPLPAIHERSQPNIFWEGMRRHEVDDTLLRKKFRQLKLDDK